MKENRKAEKESGGQPERIIIQLSEFCGAELTWTRANFLFLSLPSATSPCRGCIHAPCFYIHKMNALTMTQKYKEI